MRFFGLALLAATILVGCGHGGPGQTTRFDLVYPPEDFGEQMVFTLEGIPVDFSRRYDIDKLLDISWDFDTQRIDFVVEPGREVLLGARVRDARNLFQLGGVPLADLPQALRIYLMVVELAPGDLGMPTPPEAVYFAEAYEVRGWDPQSNRLDVRYRFPTLAGKSAYYEVWLRVIKFPDADPEKLADRLFAAYPDDEVYDVIACPLDDLDPTTARDEYSGVPLDCTRIRVEQRPYPDPETSDGEHHPGHHDQWFWDQHLP